MSISWNHGIPHGPLLPPPGDQEGKVARTIREGLEGKVTRTIREGKVTRTLWFPTVQWFPTSHGLPTV